MKRKLRSLQQLWEEGSYLCRSCEEKASISAEAMRRKLPSLQQLWGEGSYLCRCSEEKAPISAESVRRKLLSLDEKVMRCSGIVSAGGWGTDDSSRGNSLQLQQRIGSIAFMLFGCGFGVSHVIGRWIGSTRFEEAHLILLQEHIKSRLQYNSKDVLIL